MILCVWVSAFMQLSSRATTALTLGLVAAASGAVFLAISVSKRMVTCEPAIELPGGGQQQRRMIFYIDFERQLMATTEGDKPIAVSAGEVTWTHSGATPDARSQATETGRIDRETGALTVRRRLVALNGEVTETRTQGNCIGAR